MMHRILDRLDADRRRAIRIETRLVRLMEHLGLDADGELLPAKQSFPEIIYHEDENFS